MSADGIGDGEPGPETPEAPREPNAAYRATHGEQRLIPPHPTRIDLHTHTRRSDGVLEPVELVRASRAAGVQMLAITDHDTLAGFRELLSDDAFEIVIPGVEINSVAEGIDALWEGELHILGLGVDSDDEAFEAALVEQRRRRVERFFRIVRRLRDLGMPIDEQVERLDPADGASLGRPHLARMLVEAGHATSVDDAMQRVLARGKPGYEPRVGMGPAAAIGAIRAAGGLPVLAHFADAPRRRSLIEELKAEGLGGLEVHYRHFGLETVEALAEFARTLGLVATGGSDYHGDLESYAEAHAQTYVPDAVTVPLHEALAAADAGRSAWPARPGCDIEREESRS